MEEYVGKVRVLLTKVSRSLGALVADRRGGNAFNVFRLCSVGHRENAHSRILAEFLDPRGMHGMDDTFLRLFLRQPIIAEYLEQQGFPKDDGLHGWDKLGTAVVVTKESKEYLKAASKSEKLKLHYSFYSEDNPRWLYGCWPHDKELWSWSDDLLARAIDADFCREFARKIANCLQTLLEEAEEVNGSL